MLVQAERSVEGLEARFVIEHGFLPSFPKRKEVVILIHKNDTAARENHS
jgi:hypothetical protein